MSTTSTAVEPVRRSVTVERPVEQAFRLFTEGIASWWPGGGPAPGAPGGTVVLEPREGGRIYERASDGSISYWGEIVAWEPPRRLVVAWQPNPNAPAPTELEVRFSPAGNQATTVELEHRGWERLGERAERARAEYDAGWDGVLDRYASAGRDNGFAIASFVLGIVSLVVPFAVAVGGPVGTVFGILGIRRANRGARHHGFAVAGLVLSAVAVVVWALAVVLVFGGHGTSGGGVVTGQGVPVGPPPRHAPTQPTQTH